jgi:hypothetical protein
LGVHGKIFKIRIFSGTSFDNKIEREQTLAWKIFKIRIFSGTSFDNKIGQGAMVVMILAGEGAMPWIRLLN